MTHPVQSEPTIYEGFEGSCGSKSVFKTGTFGRSVTPPNRPSVDPATIHRFFVMESPDKTILILYMIAWLARPGAKRIVLGDGMSPYLLITDFDWLNFQSIRPVQAVRDRAVYGVSVGLVNTHSLFYRSDVTLHKGYRTDVQAGGLPSECL